MFRRINRKYLRTDANNVNGLTMTFEQGLDNKDTIILPCFSNLAFGSYVRRSLKGEERSKANTACYHFFMLYREAGFTGASFA